MVLSGISVAEINKKSKVGDALIKELFVISLNMHVLIQLIRSLSCNSKCGY